MKVKFMELFKGAVRNTAKAVVVTKRVATPPAKASIAFASTLASSARDEYNKAKVAKEQELEEPEQLDLPLEVIEDHETGQRTVTILRDGDPNETAQKA